jgi:hypothetical protein
MNEEAGPFSRAGEDGALPILSPPQSLKRLSRRTSW